MSLSEGAPARSGRGVKPGHPDVTTDDTAPSTHARLPEVARRVFRMRPQGVTRTLSAAEQGEAERPGDGCPCVGAEETCGVPPQTLWCGTRTNTVPSTSMPPQAQKKAGEGAFTG